MVAQAVGSRDEVTKRARGARGTAKSCGRGRDRVRGRIRPGARSTSEGRGGAVLGDGDHVAAMRHARRAPLGKPSFLEICKLIFVHILMDSHHMVVTNIVHVCMFYHSCFKAKLIR